MELNYMKKVRQKIKQIALGSNSEDGETIYALTELGCVYALIGPGPDSSLKEWFELPPIVEEEEG